jgi:hypothetical protein
MMKKDWNEYYTIDEASKIIDEKIRNRAKNIFRKKSLKKNLWINKETLYV